MASVNSVPLVKKPELPTEVYAANYYLEVRGGLCCGLVEINGLTGLEESPCDPLTVVIVKLWGRLQTLGAVLFTDAFGEDEDEDEDEDDYRDSYDDGLPTYASNLKADIERFGLGTVTVSEPFLNRNSGRLVRLYTWIPIPFQMTALLRKRNPKLADYMANGGSD